MTSFGPAKQHDFAHIFSPRWVFILPPPKRSFAEVLFSPVCLFVCLSVFLFVCLFVCLFVNNFLTTILVVERWNLQGLIATLRSGSDSILKGQGQDLAKGQIHLIGYSFASNCHRDFKLGSYFSLWKAAPTMTLTLTFNLDIEKFAQGQNFWNISIKENLSKYAWIVCTGHNLLLARSKSRSRSSKRSDSLYWL